MGVLRVPDKTLARLRAAAPPGTPLARVVEEALRLAGGASKVRETLAASTQRQGAVAAARRRVAAGYRDAVMDPGDQVALATATGDWVHFLEQEGLRSYDPASRAFELAPRRKWLRPSAERLSIRRSDTVIT